MVSWLPVPRRMPPEVALPESTMMRFEPRLWICSATRAWAPAPTPTIAMTAATPMMMPSIVRALRSLLTRSERMAIRTLCQTLTRAGAAMACGHARVLEGQLDVLERARPRQEVELLEDEADLRVPDPGERVRRQAGDILTAEHVAAGGGRVEAAQEVHEGGLAGARRS